MCRNVIRQALGKKLEVNKLRLPSRLKLFLQYNIPYPGFCMVVVPPTPWTQAQLFQDEANGEEVKEFITKHASEEFLTENTDILGKGSTGEAQSQDLVRLFQEMYLWEAFKPIEFEEPLPRQPRYSLEHGIFNAQESTTTSEPTDDLSWL
jgi:hypothetical protein